MIIESLSAADALDQEPGIRLTSPFDHGGRALLASEALATRVTFM